MQRQKRAFSGGHVQSAFTRHRGNFVCVLGRDPERNKISTSHLWTWMTGALGFASFKVAIMLPVKPEGMSLTGDTNPLALGHCSGIEL
jgi:hypothetical protein